ncbi:hypothetical protein HF086_006327 [Spodoptera exigua]|uniref:Seminal fluid protein n=1 Tax=Spodoptera exigua TaxID=7107 RepID=A0A922MRK1_SPOEX|nr:hypothetical protein HF086_006327 [Spodoptera exigua]
MLQIDILFLCAVFIVVFDNSGDLYRLSTTIGERKTNHKTIGDYIDLNDLIKKRSDKNVPKDYVKDLLILSEPPIHLKCDKHGKCDEDLRKFSKINKKADLEWKHKRMPLGTSKRFRIVDNKTKKRPKIEMPERNPVEDAKNKRRPPPIFNKKNYLKETASGSDESQSISNESHVDSQGYESDSEESSSKERKKSGSSKKNVSKEASGDHSSASSESWEVEREVYESKSKSEEEFKEDRKRKKSKLKRKKDGDSSSETNSEDNSDVDEWSKEKKKRKKNSKKLKKKDTGKKLKKKEDSEVEESWEDNKNSGSDDIILQGNKIYRGFERRTKEDANKRRRLQHFMPKRYHWEASDFGDLGYYWYNGPKGMYPEPQTLIAVQK